MRFPGPDVAPQIRAAIDAFEQAAQAVGTTGSWKAKGQLVTFEQGVVASTLDTFDSQGATAKHIALNDPELVLRRCTAGREMLKTIESMRDKADKLASRGVGHAPYELFVYAAALEYMLALEWNVDFTAKEAA